MGKNRGVDDTSEESRLQNTESVKDVSKKVVKMDDDKSTKKIEIMSETQKQQGKKEKSIGDSGNDNSKRKGSAKTEANVSDKIRTDTKDKETSAKKSDKSLEKQKSKDKLDKSESSKKEKSDTKKSREKLKSRDKKGTLTNLF